MDLSVKESEGFVTQDDIRGEYTAYLVNNEEILYEVNFNIADEIERFPGPECFDENMVLDTNICPNAFSTEQVKNPYFRLQLPIINEAERIDIYQGEQRVATYGLSKKNSLTWIYYLAGILIIIIFGMILGKYYKQKKSNKQKVI